MSNLAETSARATLPFESSSEAWNDVCALVESFVQAWQRGEAPPDLNAFLPDRPWRRLALIELIKVDLEYRWPHPAHRRTLEEYAALYPELRAGGDLPSDLVYEELLVRRQSGETIQLDEYERRFPRQATQLARLDGLQRAATRTVLLQTGKLDELTPGQRLGDFELERLLGKGAFARVFLARQVNMQRRVALKVSADRGMEPQTMAQLDHPNIVRVYDQQLLPEQKLRLLYMQYVGGGTLEGVVQRVRSTPAAQRSGRLLLEAVDATLRVRGETPPADSRTRRRLAEADWPMAVCWLGAQLARALAYAHQQNVLHRDLKPANVLLAPDGSPRLADFNVSFCAGVEGDTADAFFGGSLAYMSPEQLEAFHPDHHRRPDELDGRSDVYALGILLWELLTGSRPFADEVAEGGWLVTLEHMLARRRAGPPPAALELLRTQCPRDLEEVLRRALAADPAQRYPSAAVMARHLELCLQPQVQRLLKPRGNRRAVLARHSVLATLAAGLLPNVVLSLLNIAYNWREIVAPLGKDAERVFVLQLAGVNPLAYGSAVAFLLWLAWPALMAARRLALGGAVEGKRRSALRRRTLQLGSWVAVVTAAEWALSGLVFPVWLHGGSPARMSFEHYVHFLVSQTLCGLMSATLAFFAVTFLAVRAFYPLLVEAEQDDPEAVVDLARLARHTAQAFYVAVGAPFVAILAMTGVDSGGGRWALGVLAGAGFLAFLAAFHWSRAIQRDIAALQQVAMVPSSEAFTASSEAADLFWTGSR
jgi:serine/threonine protein kinase